MNDYKQWLIAFGSRLRAERERQGLTRNALAAKSGVKVDYIEQIECGAKCPSMEKLCLLLSVLDVSADSLIFGATVERIIDIKSLWDKDFENKYLHGSVWHWENTRETKPGVQGKERPVLIISNDTFNQYSPVVNCLTITSILKESPVHVPLFMGRESHIQCEQIFTINKTELVDLKGILPETTLLNVKDKLKIQFNIEDFFDLWK